MNGYIIGIDSGGTKTKGVLFDMMGNQIKDIYSGFGNFNVDASMTKKHIFDVLDSLTEEIDVLDLKFILIGVAGYSNYSDKDKFITDISKKYQTKVKVVTDALVALYSVKKDKYKQVVMVLGGTGSVIMALVNNKIHFIGGYGPLLGDEGSSYHLVIEEFKHIINQFEEKKKVTDLTKALLNKIEAKTYTDIKAFVYNNSKNKIANLSQFIALYALKGDEEAIALFVKEGELLAKQTYNAYRLMNLNYEIRIGVRGGFLLNAPYVLETLIKSLNQMNIKYTLDDSMSDPIVGAYYLAMESLKEEVNNG